MKNSSHRHTHQASTPVEVSRLLACRDGVRLGIAQLHQLHEQVRLRQAEQRVNQRKVRLVKVELLLEAKVQQSLPEQRACSSAQSLAHCSRPANSTVTLRLDSVTIKTR